MIDVEPTRSRNMSAIRSKDTTPEMIVRRIKDPYTVGNINDAPAHGQMLCGALEQRLNLV